MKLVWILSIPSFKPMVWNLISWGSAIEMGWWSHQQAVTWCGFSLLTFSLCTSPQSARFFPFQPMISAFHPSPTPENPTLRPPKKPKIHGKFHSLPPFQAFRKATRLIEEASQQQDEDANEYIERAWGVTGRKCGWRIVSFCRMGLWFVCLYIYICVCMC